MRIPVSYGKISHFPLYSSGLIKYDIVHHYTELIIQRVVVHHKKKKNTRFRISKYKTKYEALGISPKLVLYFFLCGEKNLVLRNVMFFVFFSVMDDDRNYYCSEKKKKNCNRI